MGAPWGAAPPARPRRRWRAAWWLLPVLLLHVLALWGLGSALRRGPAHALPAALYTQVLLPQAPRAPRPAAPAAAKAQSPARAVAQAQGPELLAPAPRHAPAPRQARPVRRPRAPEASRPAPAAPPRPADSAPSPSTAGHGPAQAGSQAHASAHPATHPATQPVTQPPTHPVAAPSAPGSGAGALADAWPPPTRLDYALTGYYRGPLHGNGELEWRRQGPRYQLRLSGSALIDFSYTSTGSIQADWLAPDDYVEQVLLRSKSVRFDRAAGLLRFSAIGSTLPIPAHLLDSASVFMQLAQDLRSQPGRFQPGAHLRFQVARPSGTTTWDFLVAGQAQVPTRLGPLPAWHLVYEPAVPEDLGAEVWLAPSLQGLPVQIRLRHGRDDYLLFTLRRALQQAAPPGSAGR